ncbi:putative bifunctional diguanylate cyclase/phosphodiesterase [Saccharopolyspora sp. 5N708]|uniref:putative bifunctional diguanylate cyclase/phosphodiesterase n=1 Tax=Saccharopolyspora sp. 5N708 TaxID=3457424 RepID=UPI003FD32001
MQKPSRRPDLTPAAPDDDRGRTVLARKWTYLLSRAVVVPLTNEELGRELRDQLDAFCDALHGEPFTAQPAEQVGERLAVLGYVGDEGLRCTLNVLGKGLLALPEFQPSDRFAERIVAGLGALAGGFVVVNQRFVLEQQESMQLSLRKAFRDAESHLAESEARFEQVATSSTSGILITDLDGRLVRANDAIADILGYPPAELAETTLFDLVHPDSATLLRHAVRVLIDGEQDRIRQSQRLFRKDGYLARISLTASMLRSDDQPGQLVIVVEDETDLEMLQGELNRQALHDVLTGLPNRQYFTTRLESALRRADAEHGITLFYLDLDGFGMVCNGLGRRAGERLLVHVGQRLKVAMADEQHMIARFDGDEFAILVQNSATTPEIATTIAKIHAELAEPIYVDGHGLAASVSVGVVHRPPADSNPDNLLRAADVTLRRAKAGRRGQWELFHPGQDADDRRTHSVAVGMPGAWENGEIEVVYQPVVDLAGGRVAGVEALLSWERPDLDPLPHQRCAQLAERTGLILPLGEWLMRTACGQTEWWRRRGFDLPLTIGLTKHQACDADLVSRVIRLLDDTGLPPGQLEIGVPLGTLSTNEAVDNLAVLADLGTHPVLDDFDLGPDAMAAVADLPVRSVRLSRRLVQRQARSDTECISAMLPLVHRAGVTTIVNGINTAEQAAWWHEAGAHRATGDLFGTALPPGEALDRFGNQS